MDSRPVIRRTDQSAEDFWSRVRHSQEYNDSFKIINNPGFAECVRNDLPFGKQIPPKRPYTTTLPPLRSSRSIERMVYRVEINNFENFQCYRDSMCNENKRMAQEIIVLKQQNQVLRENMNRVLRINSALAGNMLRTMRTHK